MRKDMPRLASVRNFQADGGRKLPTRGQMPRNEELLPQRQSIRAAVPHYTGLRVVKRGPVGPWLRQQAGRPWDDVYSELCATFDKRNGVKAQVLASALRQVELHNVYFDTVGQARVKSPYSADGYAVDGLYVHPHTRKLCYQELERMSRARWHAQQAANAPVQKVQVSPRLQLRELDGLWYWIELAPLKAAQYIRHPERVFSDGSTLPGYVVLVRDSVCRDVLTGREYHSPNLSRYAQEELKREYGAPGLYACAKRQASHKDVCTHVPEQRLAA